VNVLIDTHILLWWLADDRALPDVARTVIADPATAVVVSAATVWEIAIKQAAGRLDAPDNLMPTLNDNDFDTLPMTASHAFDAARLPLHHTDPFDRMLIAQAAAENLTLVTVDRRFTHYDVPILPLA
jgi:PIN domain nuclease of toxin-antitoxin system